MNNLLSRSLVFRDQHEIGGSKLMQQQEQKEISPFAEYHDYNGGSTAEWDVNITENSFNYYQQKRHQQKKEDCNNTTTSRESDHQKSTNIASYDFGIVQPFMKFDDDNSNSNLDYGRDYCDNDYCNNRDNYDFVPDDSDHNNKSTSYYKDFNYNNADSFHSSSMFHVATAVTEDAPEKKKFARSTAAVKNIAVDDDDDDDNHKKQHNITKKRSVAATSSSSNRQLKALEDFFADYDLEASQPKRYHYATTTASNYCNNISSSSTGRTYKRIKEIETSTKNVFTTNTTTTIGSNNYKKQKTIDLVSDDEDDDSGETFEKHEKIVLNKTDNAGGDDYSTDAD